MGTSKWWFSQGASDGETREMVFNYKVVRKANNERVGIKSHEERRNDLTKKKQSRAGKMDVEWGRQDGGMGGGRRE